MPSERVFNRGIYIDVEEAVKRPQDVRVIWNEPQWNS